MSTQIPYTFINDEDEEVTVHLVNCLSPDEWTVLSNVYAFLGNSYLKPMTQTETMGLTEEFWDSMPEFPHESSRKGLELLKNYARRVSEIAPYDAKTACAVEFTQLFVGPPSPAVAPWETLNGDLPAECAFGEPTYDMQRRLKHIGLTVSGENNQYADHIGIELLYISELCRQLSLLDGEDDSEARETELIGLVFDMLVTRLLTWVDTFSQRIESFAPTGYFVGLTKYVKGLAYWQVEQLHQEL